MLIIFAAALAFAQPAPRVLAPPPIVSAPAIITPSDEAIAEAAKMFAGDAFRDQLMAGVMIGINQSVNDEIARAGADGMLDEEVSARIQDALTAEFAAIIDTELAAFRREAALLYARRFSLEELRELNALMQQPVFRKLEQLAPLLSLEIAQVSVRLFEPHMPALMERAGEIANEIMAGRRGGSRS